VLNVKLVLIVYKIRLLLTVFQSSVAIFYVKQDCRMVW